MEGTSTSVWGATGAGSGMDKLGPLLQQQQMNQNGTGQHDPTGLMPGFVAPDGLASSTSDPNSVLRIQQNLQRLYGSFGQLHGSRASLPDIQEEEAAQMSAAGLSGGAQSIATPALQVPQPGRSLSEDDLFRMDPVSGSSTGAQQLADLTLVGQMPSDGAESRTLFVRGIDPSSSDDELVKFFEYFGDVRALYSAAKNRGMVVIGYHDIRAATLAHHTLNGPDTKFRNLTCQFTRPKDAAEAAAGSLLLMSLDGSLQTKEDFFFLLSKYGELRELKMDPTRPNAWIAEYYDTRHAAAAITGITQSPHSSGRLLVLDAGSIASQGIGQSQLRNTASSPSLGALGGSASNPQLDASSLLLGGAGGAASYLSGGGGGHGNHLEGMTRSLSEISLEGGSANASGLFGGGAPGGLMGHMAGPSLSTNDLLNAAAAAGPSQLQGLGGLRGAASTGSLWTQSSTAGLGGGPSMGSSPLGGGVWPAGGVGMSSLAGLQPEQVALLQQQQQQQQNVLMQTAAVQALQQALLVQQAQQAAFARTHPVIGGLSARRNFSEPALGGRLARRPADPIAEAERRAQQERLYSLDIQKIMGGEDKRTTLMVKNIPNKYTQKMLLSLIEERFKGTFDFFYLPIDFKNRCNVGYAFINMTHPTQIPPLVKEFHGKRWPKFNSEKICHIAYARIQGKTALVQHFQNSSLLHEDKRCRPVLFKAEGEGTGEPEAFPLGPASLLVDANGGATSTAGAAINNGAVAKNSMSNGGVE